MQYKNGLVVLPPKLLKEVQEYVNGEIVYIPCRKSVKAKWGEQSGTKAMLEERNLLIYEASLSGQSVIALSQQYFLSEDRIRRIIAEQKKKIAQRRIYL